MKTTSVPIFFSTFYSKQPLNLFKARFCPILSGHNRDTTKHNYLIYSFLGRDNRDTKVSRNRDTLVSRLSRRIALIISNLTYKVSRLCPDLKRVKVLIDKELTIVCVLKIGTLRFSNFSTKTS